ncbi:hypothetical protein NPA31_010505 [Aurantimonas sp. MSK8Z-1]|uniref:hypothetical protein n=1 Tax=Mangrovibrevibacter kandeliae TaxID=2968473 RepID=UPI00211758B6|nr:hypothetical protein [Aurantimonas sp. MSK8Z-1]MCW4115390.1 hypothetical protein [Aurantimonas sp. MSK8Z-1]
MDLARLLLPLLIGTGSAAADIGGLSGLGCGEGAYWHLVEPQACGSNDQMGICAERPIVCRMIFAPVCDCDGQTDSNACGAAAVGINVASKRACVTRPNSGPSRSRAR